MISIIFLLGILCELGLVFVPGLWRYRQFTAAIVTGLIGFWTGIFVMTEWHALAILLFVVSIYRLFNLLRIGKGHKDSNHLLSIVRRTSLVLMLSHLLLYGLFSRELFIKWDDALTLLVTAPLLASFTILGVTARNLFKTKHHTTKHFFSDKELPTVTVAIPARNETVELASCLQSIISSNYPKLEILVLDDCSLDRTPEIIRDFAQDGVRFIEGKPPKAHWLAKNQAYQQLSEAASGELVLFCGVDVRLGSESIRALVTTMLNKKRDMISVMPLRVGGGVRTAFVQPMRYWWELALPRRFFNRPPVLSSCWLIKRATLKKLGGFAAVSKTILPEAYFARELVKSDGYALTRADEHLDVRTVKGVEAQLSTAIRTRYPQLRKRPENVLLLSAVLILFLLTPFLLVAQGLISDFRLETRLALTASLLLVFAHYLILAASNPANSVISLFNFPFVVLTEIVLLHVSMYRYEFSTVRWKGRNICIPVMNMNESKKLKVKS